MSPCQSFIDNLRQQGFRMTHQREAIIEAFAHSGNHISADEVYSRIKRHHPRVNIATVYRTLDLLVERGLASRIDLGAGRVIYATHQHGPHIHLVCRQCGQVTDANQSLLVNLNDQLNHGYQFAADLQHISVLGLCRGCQARQNHSGEM